MVLRESGAMGRRGRHTLERQPGPAALEVRLQRARRRARSVSGRPQAVCRAAAHRGPIAGRSVRKDLKRVRAEQRKAARSTGQLLEQPPESLLLLAPARRRAHQLLWPAPRVQQRSTQPALRHGHRSTLGHAGAGRGRRHGGRHRQLLLQRQQRAARSRSGADDDVLPSLADRRQGRRARASRAAVSAWSGRPGA